MRRDLAAIEPDDALLAEPRLLLAHRQDLVFVKTRAIGRLRDVLLALFPGFERALDLTNKGALTLVRRYQTPGAVRRSGRNRIERHLKAQGVRGATRLAGAAVGATKAQRVVLPAESVASGIAVEIAEKVLALKERVDALDEELEEIFASHPSAEILASFPGMGPLLGAEFLVAVGDTSAFAGSGHLAAYAGLAPASRDSGKRTGNNKRMRGRAPLAATRRSSVLPVGLRQPLHAGVRGLLRPQEGRRQKAPPGRDRPGQEEGERPLGDAERRDHFRGPVRDLTRS